MRQITVLILGSFDGSDETHLASREHLLAAGQRAGAVVNTRWLSAEDLALWPGLVAEAQAVCLAPGALMRDPRTEEALLRALSLVRAARRPFLATGTRALMVAQELARDVLSRRVAGPAEILRGRDALYAQRSLRGSTFEIALDEHGRALYRSTAAQFVERGALPFALSAELAPLLERAGFQALGQDVADQARVLFRLRALPFHVTALYLPQSTQPAPHPLFAALFDAALNPPAK